MSMPGDDDKSENHVCFHKIAAMMAKSGKIAGFNKKSPRLRADFSV